MYVAIALLSLAIILKFWYLAIPVLIIQIFIAQREKGQLNFIATFITYLIVEAVFALLIFGLYRLIKLI
jgi:hypothetical protein